MRDPNDFVIFIINQRGLFLGARCLVLVAWCSLSRKQAHGRQFNYATDSTNIQEILYLTC